MIYGRIRAGICVPAAGSTFRDFKAARTSWLRARQVADRLPAEAPERASMRIVPRNLLCGTLWRVAGAIDDTGFEELQPCRQRLTTRCRWRSAMTGHIVALAFHDRYHEAPGWQQNTAELARTDR